MALVDLWSVLYIGPVAVPVDQHKKVGHEIIIEFSMLHFSEQSEYKSSGRNPINVDNTPIE